MTTCGNAFFSHVPSVGMTTGTRARCFAPALRSPPQQLEQQFGHSFRLLLLHPMAGAVEQMTAEHAGAGSLLHALEGAGALVSAPIALAGDEHRGHVDRAA